MKKTITFINRTFEQIRSAYLTLKMRYKEVRFLKTKLLRGGLYQGAFEVSDYITKARAAAINSIRESRQEIAIMAAAIMGKNKHDNDYWLGYGQKS